ncbi:Uncharacterized protein dnm_044540 [Desulfonema magnum]|uniref:Uncharacterized protein n=1 Tax=Desulfonema magnum TaxID=45655 RepID=A0A975GP31_9BACT|nr:Uncharacterized protein dnm_044540 [Desulfonema magnum]
MGGDIFVAFIMPGRPSPVGAAYLQQIMLQICRPYRAWPLSLNSL